MKVSAAVGTMVAVALIFVAGVTVGKRAGDTPQTANAPAVEKQYMLLLYTKAGGGAAPAGDALQAMIEEYRQWGQTLAEQGRLVGAEKLKGSGCMMQGNEIAELKAPPAGSRVLGGYFLIRAADLPHAQELAATHPHLKYGGEIEIRPLDLHD